MNNNIIRPNEIVYAARQQRIEYSHTYSVFAYLSFFFQMCLYIFPWYGKIVRSPPARALKQKNIVSTQIKNVSDPDIFALMMCARRTQRKFKYMREKDTPPSIIIYAKTKVMRYV